MKGKNLSKNEIHFIIHVPTPIYRENEYFNSILLSSSSHIVFVLFIFYSFFYKISNSNRVVVSISIMHIANQQEYLSTNTHSYA